MNRRGFFRRTVGAVIAATCAPLLTNGIVALDYFDLSGVTLGDGTIVYVARHKRAVAAYEAQALQAVTDPAVTTFKGIPVKVDATIPQDQIRFISPSGEVVGIITNLS